MPRTSRRMTRVLVSSLPRTSTLPTIAGSGCSSMVTRRSTRGRSSWNRRSMLTSGVDVADAAVEQADPLGGLLLGGGGVDVAGPEREVLADLLVGEPLGPFHPHAVHDVARPLLHEERHHRLGLVRREVDPTTHLRVEIPAIPVQLPHRGGVELELIPAEPAFPEDREERLRLHLPAKLLLRDALRTLEADPLDADPRPLADLKDQHPLLVERVLIHLRVGHEIALLAVLVLDQPDAAIDQKRVDRIARPEQDELFDPLIGRPPDCRRPARPRSAATPAGRR